MRSKDQEGEAHWANLPSASSELELYVDRCEAPEPIQLRSAVWWGVHCPGYDRWGARRLGTRQVAGPPEDLTALTAQLL